MLEQGDAPVRIGVSPASIDPQSLHGNGMRQFGTSQLHGDECRKSPEKQ